MKLKNWVRKLLCVLIVISSIVTISESEDFMFCVVSHVIALAVLITSLYLLDTY